MMVYLLYILALPLLFIVGAGLLIVGVLLYPWREQLIARI